jgi:hypothetical protein
MPTDRLVPAPLRAAVSGLLLVLLPEIGFAATPTGLVERVLAVVDGRPLLLSDVRVLARTRGVDETAALELLVDETLMYEQASRTPQAAVSVAEEALARAELAEQSPALVASVHEAALGRLLRRQLAILKYVDFRFRPQVRPSDEEVRQAYDAAYGGREEAPTLETVADALRQKLTREKLGERVEAWARELRRDADVRYVAPATESASE